MTQLPDNETVFAFDTGDGFSPPDVTVRVSHNWDTGFANIALPHGSIPYDVRLALYAEDLGKIGDAFILPLDHGGYPPDPVPIELKGHEELCEPYQLPALHPGSLIQGPSSDIYFYGNDLMRHAFPDDTVFKDWFPEGAPVIKIAGYRLASIPLGKNVTLKPGSLVRVGTENAFYLVGTGARLHPLLSQLLMNTLFGPVWASLVLRVDAAQLASYIIGSAIYSERDATSVVTTDPSMPDIWPTTSTPSVQTDADAVGVFDGQVVFLGTPYPTGDIELRFQLYGKNGDLITSEDLEVVHEERIHNFIMQNDLTGFQHIHPREKDGIWRVKTHFTDGGIYAMDFDILPVGGKRLIFRTPLLIGEDPVSRSSYPVPRSDLSADDNPFRAELHAKDLIPGKTAVLTFAITKDGAPVRDLESFFAEYGHLVILEQQDPRFYIHTHPPDKRPPKNGEVTFNALFTHPGYFTFFAQFQVNGTIHTFPITAEVKADPNKNPAP